ncbi:hypothetical protein LXA43DRAFT_139394 [Ganoderma leucocontextum]|nr:hypothetical protein LXA43DRAFT_139394 [Ganoderma leucocontextum]
MNTPQTMASQSSPAYVRAGNKPLALTGQMLGWGGLVVAAAVSFYYAKKTIVERRQMYEAAGQWPRLDGTSFDLGSLLKHHVSPVGVLHDTGRSRIDQHEKKTLSAQSTSPSTGASTAVDVGSAGKGPS